MSDIRQVPHSNEAEQAFLCSFLIDPDMCFETVAHEVDVNDFYTQKHRLIYRHLNELNFQGVDVDITTLMESLRVSNELETAGGPSYLVGLMQAEGTAAFVQSYADIIKKKSLLREAIKLSGQLMQAAYDEEEIDSVVKMGQDGLLKLIKENSKGEWKDANQTSEETKGQIEDYGRSETGITGLPTGIKKLDDLTAGLHKGQMVTIAAASGVGKTTLALSVAIDVCFMQHKKVGIFSLEMPAKQLGIKMVSRVASIDSQRLRRPNMLGGDDRLKVFEALDMLAKQGLWIDDSGSVTIQQVQSRSNQLMAKYGFDLIIIDYIQLLESKHRGNREQQISEITRGIKILAMQLDVPIIALSQLSRAVEARPDKRPRLSDLRESGSIGQNSDVVMFIYRDEYYNPDSEEKGYAEIIVSKQREGPVGTIKTGFIPSQSRFIDVEE